jgi:hypothetical protein
MSRDHRRKREPIAAILARRQADLDRVWNEAKRCRYGAAAMTRTPMHLQRIQEAREAEAAFALELDN